MVAWDARKKAQEYLQKANAIHPEESRFEGGYEQDLALQNVYYECYMMSFDPAKLKEFLASAVDGKVKMPENDEEEIEIDQALYRQEFMKHAKSLLVEFEQRSS
jgi:hypothetical protein